jgi:hypothetical protein
MSQAPNLRHKKSGFDQQGRSLNNSRNEQNEYSNGKYFSGKNPLPNSSYLHDVWGGRKTKEQRTECTSLGWGVNTPRQDRNGFSSLSYLSTNSPFVNIGSSNKNGSLPKLSNTLCKAGAETNFSRSSSSSDFSWSGSSSRSSRRNSSETALFGDPRKKLNWDKIVDKVFKEEIVKLADTTFFSNLMAKLVDLDSLTLL